MPTFSGMHATLIVASILAVALTGLFSAPSSFGEGGDATTVAEAVATPVKSASEYFADGDAAFDQGRYDDAVANWQRAADAGYLMAQWNLARMLANGEGVPPDPELALKYLRMAAAQHDADLPYGPRSALTVEALVELAEVYRDGLAEAGLAPMPGRAAAMFEHAATLYGHPRAQNALGLMYLKGQGVRQDLGRAVRWLMLAARKNHAPAQAALGDIFWNNGAAEANKARGLMWFALARQNARTEGARATFEARYQAAAAEADEAARRMADDLIASWNQRGAVAAR